MDTKKYIQHWITTADDDFKTMKILYDTRRYPWALFLGHITLEKLLKAYFISVHNKHAPPIHNLLRLAEKSGLELPAPYADWLDNITLFNLNARYDDYNREFYKLCTPEYTRLWIQRITEIRDWLLKKLNE